MITPRFVLIHILLSIFFVWLLAWLGSGFMPQRFRNLRARLAIYAATTALLVLTEYFVPHSLVIPARVALYLSFFVTAFRGRIAQYLMVLALCMLMAVAGEVLTLVVVGVLGIGHLMGTNGITAFTCGFSFLIALLIRDIKRTIEGRLSWRAWFMVGYCVATTLLISLQFWYIYCLNFMAVRTGADILLSRGDILPIALMLMQLGIVYVLFSIVHEMNRNMEALNSVRLGEAKVLRELKQIHLEMESADRTYRLQHDMKNHLLAIEALSGDAQRQLAYIRRLADELAEDEASVPSSQPGNGGED